MREFANLAHVFGLSNGARSALSQRVHYHLFPARVSSVASLPAGTARGKNVGEKGRTLTAFASGEPRLALLGADAYVSIDSFTRCDKPRRSHFRLIRHFRALQIL